ncbi:hypothetical protein HU200_014754 [Digitaria exilis]|uniref:Uncharacterized protein n=1 Tax=Digitaria exilis TaxID=1010633 RepID=A0A835FBD2_9POAL|nr:hypothetical protein HU200_014754 [Digitaria exilis]
MEGAFDLNTRIFLSLNSKLPYGDKSPRMEFFEAAFKGDLRRLREMASGKDAKAKARLADVCVGGQGPLQAAARMGRLDVVDCMVKELGFDINVGSSETGVTALHAAALDGKLDTVRYLLDNGADPNKKDEPGEVPLHCAAKYGHDEVTRLLLSRGASVDVVYFHGTLLHIAAVYGNFSRRFDVFSQRFDPNKVSEALGTPLVATLHATSDGLAESIALKCVKLLVECGAMPIEIAASHGRRMDVEILFPGTSPIQTVSKWTVDGILAYAKSKQSKSKVEKYGRTTKLKLKLDGEKAVERKDYLSASKLYGEAIELDSTDAILYSNRSFCLLQIGKAPRALTDANTCIRMRPEWLKGY